jgi:ATP-dependent helicase/nuclease subunit A
MTTDTPTTDDEARRQIREWLDQTLFVEASAGTGKTSALVDRYVSLVLAGKTVDHIVAITFTEKAAAELRDRVRREMEQRRPGLDPAQQALIDRALSGLDAAPVSTIHAFCLTLLRVLAVDAGVDPTFGMLDEVASERRFDERWRTYLENLGDDDVARRVMSRVLDLGLWPGDLQRLAHDLYVHPELVARLQTKPLVAPPASWPDIEALRRSLTECHPESIIDGDLLRAALLKIVTFLNELEAAGTEREAYLATRAADFSPRLGNTGRAGAWGGSAVID